MKWREFGGGGGEGRRGGWEAGGAEAKANIDGFAAAMRAGEPADSVVAMDLAEEHRRHLNKWFYDCVPAMHRGIGDLYVSDERYMAPYEEIHPGFAQYVHDAIHANADRLG